MGYPKMNLTSQQIDELTARYGRKHPLTLGSACAPCIASSLLLARAVIGNRHDDQCEVIRSNVRV
jgi:hypothetical protein